MLMQGLRSTAGLSMLSAAAMTPSAWPESFLRGAPAIERGTMLDWHPISDAPSDCDLQLSVIEKGEIHMLIFPCRRAAAGWIDSRNGKQVSVDPTHWRVWAD
jgi:hypothetical protein